ncbi:MAG TPA: nitronate monooxygenase [Usitatibacter sp.]|jgi:nitronate monooxygenase|nr:nitronate monooxygenase [Usitatibacter sp.]
MIETAFTRMFGLAHPIALAPMGAVSGGQLAAAVSNAGGFGFVGGGYGVPEWLRTELAIVARATERPWGVGFITWSITPEAFEIALAARPAAVFLSFGDPRPHARRVRDIGAKLFCQVQDLASARLAVEAGADVIVAEGTEAGGHGGRRGTFALVPAVADVAGSIPVLAAGGIADGRGLAAALMLGAQGVSMGTRFFATVEALAHPAIKQRLVDARADDTTRTRVFDIVRGYAWPDGIDGRAVRNPFASRWSGREAELQQRLERERPAYFAAAQAGDCDTAVVWAGEGVDLIDRIEPAAEVVRRVSADAEARFKERAR